MPSQNLTIVIPTYNRPNDLQRLVAFFQRQGIGDVSFVVADSSLPAIRKVNAETVKGLGEKVQYLESDPDGYWRIKFLGAVAAVQTEFMAFCADDDLMKLDTAIKSAKFLHGNSDYSACHGMYVTYNDYDGKATIDRIEYDTSSIKQSSPYKRVIELFIHYEALFYAVMRKELMASYLSAAASCDMLMHQEIMQGQMLVILGKVHRFRDLYYMRYPLDTTATRKYWEPTECLADVPDQTFADFANMRESLIDYANAIGPDGSFDNDILRRSLNFGYMSYIYFNASLLDIADHSLPKQISTTLLHYRHHKPQSYSPWPKGRFINITYLKLRPLMPEWSIRLLRPILFSAIVQSVFRANRLFSDWRAARREKDRFLDENIRIRPQVSRRLSHADKKFLKDSGDIMLYCANKKATKE